jgi:hypothetical protein
MKEEGSAGVIMVVIGGAWRHRSIAPARSAYASVASRHGNFTFIRTILPYTFRLAVHTVSIYLPTYDSWYPTNWVRQGTLRKK